MIDTLLVIGLGFFKKFTNKLTPPEAKVYLALATSTIALGENLQGTLTVESKEDFETTEVRCEIQCVEQSKVIKEVYDATLRTNVPKVVEQSAVIFSAKPSLSNATHFGNGEKRDFPLNINIPAGGHSTIMDIDHKVTWSIKGVLAVDGRPDRTSSMYDLQIVKLTSQPVIQREVIKTVVMIPCKYCQTLMDQTVTACPNCGARRTI
jgi:hypothetical protein